MRRESCAIASEKVVWVSMGGGFYGAMGDIQGLTWALKKSETEAAAAQRRLDGIRNFLAEIEPAAHAVLPAATTGWRSLAGELYAGRLEQARGIIVAMLKAATEAERSARNELHNSQALSEELSGDLWRAERERDERAAKGAAELARAGSGSIGR